MSEFAGRLKERVAVTKAAGVDAAGAPLPYRDHGICWAEIRPERVQGAQGGARRGGRNRWRITMRAGAATGGDLDARVGRGDRLRWRGLTLAILDVVSDPAAPDRVILYGETIA
ncbi:MAG: head-tail adaptor protein [Pseudomonadota bacterium]